MEFLLICAGCLYRGAHSPEQSMTVFTRHSRAPDSSRLSAVAQGPDTERDMVAAAIVEHIRQLEGRARAAWGGFAELGRADGYSMDSSG
jgi:hypothetical protein